MQAPAIQQRSNWLRELIAAWGFVQRNYYLTKRYFMWELVWLFYSTVNAMSIGFIGLGVGQTQQAADSAKFTSYLLIGALLWSYLSMLFDVLSETVSWERWEGTIEYTMMSPISRMTYLLGSCLFGVIYGLARSTVVLIVLVLTFNLTANSSGLLPALLIVSVGSLSFVGIGIMAATLPLLFTEKGAQMTYVIEALLLLISGVYYPVSVLPGWIQVFSHLSPATYILDGTRHALLGNASRGDILSALIPLIVIGVLTIPAGIFLWARAERFAKRTGRLKRAG